MRLLSGMTPQVLVGWALLCGRRSGTEVGVAIDEADFATLYRARNQDAEPAYQRVKNVITEQVTAGHWAEGELLPSENQLVQALGLSRMTINRAFRELVTEGQVARLMGVGTFVARRKGSSPLVEVRNIADEVRSRGRHYWAEVVLLRAEPAEQAVAAELELRAGEKVFHSLVVHFEDELAIQLEDRFVRPDRAPDYLAQDFTHNTPNTYLSHAAPLQRGEHIVEAGLGSADECRLLGIGGGEPCLLIRRRTWSASRPVSVARLVLPGSRYRLEGTFEQH
jgi:GntR family transcriptional regulator, histidine utilization repressor